VAAFFLALTLCSGAADAGSFQVNPIRVDMAGGTTNAAITVRNDGADPVVVQLSVVGWTQEADTDAYGATTEALVTPPIATIAPGADQIVRVGLRRAPDAQRELAYRLFVQEVPSPPKPGFTGLQVALRVGLPVFVAPLAPVARQVHWSATLRADGTIRLSLSNRGNTHIKIADLELRTDAGGEPVAREARLAYVLAGQRREWVLPAAGDGVGAAAELHIKAISDAGEIQAAVKLDR
jgi:fimbrial chaperone protein